MDTPENRPHLPFCLPEGITPDIFLTEYWQKKPLLIKNGLPDIANLLEPEDVMELAYAEEVTARLLTQNNDNPNDWQLSLSPFFDDTIEQTAQNTKHWTLLVQNLEQWSLDIAELWKAFSFLPQWQQDDIMVSYAPAGGSVGMHYDEYDVFLAQGYGKRHWQLGKMCDDSTPTQPNLPLKLISDMGDIIFDEVLEAGDVLYVPPKLSHYGVAVDDCLTFSFGLRRPSTTQLLDAIVDELTQHTQFKLPLADAEQTNNHNHASHASNELTQETLAHIKQQLITMLNQDKHADIINHAIAKSLSDRRFELVKDDEEYSIEDVENALNEGVTFIKEPAVKLFYTNEPLTFYCQGEQVITEPEDEVALLTTLTQGSELNNQNISKAMIPKVTAWLNMGLLSSN